MELHWDVIGAPSSAGAHTPGVEKAPGALRKAGPVNLIRRGCDVDDLGDVPGFRWRPDPSNAQPRLDRMERISAGDVLDRVAVATERYLAGGRGQRGGGGRGDGTTAAGRAPEGAR